MNRKINALGIITAVFTAFVGGFYEFASCILSVALIVYIFFVAKKADRITVRKNDTLLATVLFSGAYLITIIWATDRGEALLGFFRFLPVFLYLFALMQTEKEDREPVLIVVPYLGVLMTAVSFVLSKFDTVGKYFNVSGRISGFFQYSNTFALYLLIGIIILFYKEKKKIPDYILFPVLLFGIFESGSRTVFIITVFALAVMLLKEKNKKITVIGFALFIVIIAVVAVYSFVTDNFYSVGRFLTTSLSTSTFLGRLLYYKDALPIVLKHPFGMGYLGYYFAQGSFQTGVYSVMFVHNELLQFLLDIGWIPTAVFVAALTESLFSKNVPFRNKMILSVICLHSLLDMDLQYISIFIIMLSCLDIDRGKVVCFRFSMLGQSIVSGMVCVSSLYIAVFGVIKYFNNNETALKLYPFSNMAKIEIMTGTDDVILARTYADEVIESNSYVSVAYEIKASECLENGDVENYILYENKTLDNARYETEKYEKYGNVLITLIGEYENAGSYESAEYCRTELKKLAERLDNVKNSTSELAYKIHDKPNLVLSDELSDYINNF